MYFDLRAGWSPMQTHTYTYNSGNSTDNYSNGIDNDSDDNGYQRPMELTITV